MPRGIPEDVGAINQAIRKFLDTPHENGRKIGTALGVYAFFDYDEEPIYVGQTEENLRARIGRHMTNQRTDAVAMNVLDPFEVAYIEVWPMRFGKPTETEQKAFQIELSAAEYTVFQQILRTSKLRAVLNEKDIPKTDEIALPKSYRGKIIPDEIFTSRQHPDIRIARRASTIARLAQVISERDVSPGLRRTLVTQAKRLHALASERFKEFNNAIPQEQLGEETGENIA